MNLRYLVRPMLYGGTTGVVVAALGFALAAQLSVSLYLTAGIYLLAGMTAFGLLLGASSFNENAETPDSGVDGDGLLAAPTEAGPERRLTIARFGVALALSGVLGGVSLG